MKDNKHIETSITDDIKGNDTISYSQKREGSDLIRAMEILHSPDNLEGNTILTNPQVIALSLMNWASQVYGIQFFKHFVALFPKYRISGDDGRGRKELIEIANAIQREKIAENDRIIDLLGKR